MKNTFLNKTFLFLAVFAGALVANASNVHLLNGVGFSAPNVKGYTSVDNLVSGDIVLDTVAKSFYGYAGPVAGWVPLGGSAANTFHAPTMQVLTSGTTYTTPTSPTPLYIKVRMAGGGGGGGGSGSSCGSSQQGVDGGTTTFHPTGTTLLVATGGLKGGGCGISYQGGIGGTASLGAGPTGFTFTGGAGGGGAVYGGTVNAGGGAGGSNPFGGNGQSANIAPLAGVTGSGSGGAGAGIGASGNPGGGGGAGGYLEAIIASPGASYDYDIGSAGAGGAAGGSGTAGANGGSGIIIVEEFYQ